jgi:hypothetical protein
MARMTQIIANFLVVVRQGLNRSYSNLDTNNGDNGTYWIKNFEIVDREFFEHEEQTHHNHEEMVQEILDANKPIFGEVTS